MATGRTNRRSSAYLSFDPTGQWCWHGCGRPATTRDHQPALALHVHVEGSGCCQLLAACAPCNSRDGAAITRELRRASRAQHVADRAARQRRRHGLLADDGDDLGLHP